MTTGRINQVACRAAQHEVARPAAPPTERTSTAQADDAAPTPPRKGVGGAGRHVAPTAHRTHAGCSTCVRSVRLGWGRTHTGVVPVHAPLTAEHDQRKGQSRAAWRTERPLRPARHPLAPRGAQHTKVSITDAPRHPHATRSTTQKRMLLCEGQTIRTVTTPAAAARTAIMCRATRRTDHASRTQGPKGLAGAPGARCTRWISPRACDQSRNHSHDPFCSGTRAAREQDSHWSSQRTRLALVWHAAAAFLRVPGPRDAARTEPLVVRDSTPRRAGARPRPEGGGRR